MGKQDRDRKKKRQAALKSVRSRMAQDAKPQFQQNGAEGYMFGDREAQAAFGEKRKDFIERLPNIWEAENSAISGAHKKDD